MLTSLLPDPLCHAATLCAAIIGLGLASTAWSDSGRGRHAQFYVVPTPGSVVIDGKLDDWDLSGQIEMFVVEATRSTQSARIAAMYDDEALYISGEINDPTPMMNRHDPRVRPDRAWNADSVQFRIVVDPEAEYPVRETAFTYRGANAKPDTRNDIVHLILWHYTDEQTSHLQMHVGMGYRVPREEWKPFGLVPDEHFQAVYRTWDDKRGYTFEYRIPWSTLGAAQPLRGGATVAGTMQVNWSRPDGLATGGGNAWAYDVLREAGFPFQSALCWGQLIFAEEGNVPRELVSAGVAPERPLPLEFPYNLPEDSEVTLQLFDADNRAVRIIVPQQERPGGANIERWDGLDDGGNLLPAGEYQWRGIYSPPIRAQYRFSVHNSGQPSHPTDDNRGGWGADHGYPRDVIALPDGGMALSWSGCEYGWGVVRTNKDGRKVWGAKNHAHHMATDGERLFLVGGPTFHAIPGVHMIEIVDSRTTRLATGNATFEPLAGGSKETDTITGLAYGNERLYASYGLRDVIAVYDTRSGNVAETWNVPGPGRLAVRPNGDLAVISEGKVLSLANGVVTTWIDGHLDEPTSVAVAADGTAYVANQGALQNVAVFAADGTYQRSIGREGGRPAVGSYDPSGMYMPVGMALDGQGRLWVAEATDYPKRFSAWKVANGELDREFFGGSSYFAYGHIDPDRPQEIYAHNVIWEVDWEKYSSRPLMTIWRKTAPDMAPAPNVDAHSSGGGFRLVTAENGHQYGWGGAGSSRATLVYMRDGDRMRPIFGTVDPWRDNYPGLEARKAELEKEWDAARLANHHRPRSFFWQDANGDGIVQPDEVVVQQGVGQIFQVNKDLSLHLHCGRILRPTSIGADGRPVYDLANAEETPLVGNAEFGGFKMAGPDGAVYTLQHRKGPALVKWSPSGEREWYYPDLIRWNSSLNLPTVGPGRLWGMTRPMGIAGGVLAHQTYFGANQLFRTDGMYVGTVLQDGRRASATNAYTGQPEGQGGSFVQVTIGERERTFLLHGGQDVRVWEVVNLDAITDLPGGTYVHTPELVAKAGAAQEAYAVAIAGGRQIHIGSGREALETVTPVTRNIEGNRGFDARLAYDATNLYVRFDVRSPTELTNRQGEPQILFRGGNCLDIQLATDPKAAEDRDKPAAGDLRLLVTRQRNQPFAVLYRPVVPGFDGERAVLVSPTGQEAFDRIDVVEVGLDYEKKATGFTATVTVPLELLGLELSAGQTLRMDLGYIFGNSQGTQTTVRAYVNNNSFSGNVVDDIPNESRIEPQHWGSAIVE